MLSDTLDFCAWLGRILYTMYKWRIHIWRNIDQSTIYLAIIHSFNRSPRFGRHQVVGVCIEGDLKYIVWLRQVWEQLPISLDSCMHYTYNPPLPLPTVSYPLMRDLLVALRIKALPAQRSSMTSHIPKATTNTTVAYISSSIRTLLGLQSRSNLILSYK